MTTDHDDTRATVLRMLVRWGDCPTVQQLHDDAGVRPLPPIRDDHGKRRPAEMEEATCNLCGESFPRVVGSDARWTLCRPCTSRVRQRAARLAREYVAWRRCRLG